MEDLNDLPRSGRPKNTEDGKYDKKIIDIINKNPKVPLHIIAAIMHSSMTKARNYLKNVLGYKLVSCKWVPYFLNDDQKSKRVVFCKNILKKYGSLNKKETYNIRTWRRNITLSL